MKNAFQLEMKNRFAALKDEDDIDSIDREMTEIIQQNATRIANQTHTHKTQKAETTIASSRSRLKDSVGPYVISCQMFVKSEFPLDSALVCDSDQKKLGWHFFRKF